MKSSPVFWGSFSSLVQFKKLYMTSVTNMVASMHSIEMKKMQWLKSFVWWSITPKNVLYTVLNYWYPTITIVRRKESHCALADQFSKVSYKPVLEFLKQSSISSKMKFKFTSLHKVFMLFQSDVSFQNGVQWFHKGHFCCFLDRGVIFNCVLIS